MTEKEKRAHKQQIAAARAAKQEYVLKGVPVGSWSATHPAYTGTSLCPDWEQRGQRPIEVHKICLCCRRRYQVDSRETVCECGGHLYTARSHYQPKVRGGRSIGEGGADPVLRDERGD